VFVALGPFGVITSRSPSTLGAFGLTGGVVGLFVNSSPSTSAQKWFSVVGVQPGAGLFSGPPLFCWQPSAVGFVVQSPPPPLFC
jgi:hypothetical protein